jgi:hypothetical protein
MAPDSGDHKIAWANEKLRIACADARRSQVLIGEPHCDCTKEQSGRCRHTLGNRPTLVPEHRDQLEEKRTAFYLNEKIK